MRQFAADKTIEGMSAMKYVQKLLPKAPSAVLFKAFRKKNIEVNSRKATGKEVLKEGDTVRIFFSEETFSLYCPDYTSSDAKKPAVQKAELTAFKKGILYEDENVLIVNKRAGVLSQSDSSGALSLNDELAAYLEDAGRGLKNRAFRPSVCNRLDRNTSGIVICGKTHRGLDTMSSLIRERQLKKIYTCIVMGEVGEAGILRGFLAKDPASNLVKVYDEKVKDSDAVETRYTPLGRINYKDVEMTVLSVELVTGKPHQIRAHMASISHPVMGDPKYASRESLEASGKLGLDRQMLHASRVEFPKMTGDFSKLSGKTVEAPPDRQMSSLLKYMRRG